MTKEITGWINFLEIRRSGLEELDKAQLVLRESGLKGEQISDCGIVIVAELGSQVVGTVSVNSSGCIHSLAVLRDARRRGIGSMLLGGMEAEMVRDGLNKAYLIPLRSDFDRLSVFYGERGYVFLGSTVMTKSLA